MKLKVCGMREAENIRELMGLNPDFIGMIFYAKSPRFVSDPPQVTISAKKVGVFVDAYTDYILEKVAKFQLDLVQLHGEEPVAQVMALKGLGLSVIKVFSVNDQLPLEEMKPYLPYVDYFLFDTKTPGYGGSGQKFDWGILGGYDLDKPFFLSGGVALEDIEVIKTLKIDQLYAIDVNSRFEISAGVKDIAKISLLKQRL